MKHEWWTYRDILFSVADYGVETGELDSAAQVVHFFEKPHCFDDLHTAWEEDQENQAERQWLDRYADV